MTKSKTRTLAGAAGEMSLTGLAPRRLPMEGYRLATVVRSRWFMLCMIQRGMYQDFKDNGDSRAGADPVNTLCPQRQRCWGFLSDLTEPS